MDKINKTKIVSWVGTLLMVAALIFLAQRLFGLYTDADFRMTELLSRGNVIAGLIGVVLLECLGILLASANYRALLKNVSGVGAPWPLAYVIYTMANLYKYIPGGVMYVVGRNRFAVETEEINHPQVAVATVLEGALIAVAAIVLIVVTVFDHAAEYLRQEMPPIVVVIILSVLAIAAIAVFVLRQRIRDALKKLSADIRLLSFSALLKRFAFGLVLMTFWGGTFLATLMALGQPMTFSHGTTVIGLFLLSWLAGFLTPGAPSGLGVREVVMLMFLGNVLYEDILLTAMLMHRIVAALGDVLAYCVALGYAKLRAKS